MDKKAQSEQLLTISPNVTQSQQIIFEKLDDEQKQEVDSWAKGKSRFSDKFFGGKDENKQPIQRRYFDFKHSDESPVKREVHSHISKHGFEVSDYKAGLAKDKHGRDVRIGKVLNKTKADPELLKKFNEDPARSSKNAKNLKILISRHPHDVAGMTSQGHSWEDQSCMNFESGECRKKLKSDVKHGTHVAYLVHADDDKGHPENPIARIAIKKHSSWDKKHHLLVPEDSVYGEAPGGFHQQVKDILDKEHNNHQPVGIYTKHKSVYHDSRGKGRDHFHIGNDIDSALNHPLSDFRIEAIEHKNAQPHHIEKALNDPDRAVRSAAASHPNATDEQISRALNDTHPYVQLGAVNNPNFKPHHIDQALKIDTLQSNIKKRALSHPAATHEHLTIAAKDEDPDFRENVLMHPNSSKEHVEMLYKDPSKYVREHAAEHKHAQPHHLEALLNDPSHSVREAAVSNPNVTANQLHKVLSDRSPYDEKDKVYVRKRAVSHPNINASHIDLALDDPDPEIRGAILHHDQIQPHHLDKALNDHSPFVRQQAAQSTKAQPHHIEKALQDKHHSVRLVAFKSPHIQPHHIDQGLNDEEGLVKRAAISHPNAQPHHIEKALNDFDPSIRAKAAAHPNAQPHHLSKALNDDYHFVRQAAVENPHAQEHHIKKALHDPHYAVLGAALNKSAYMKIDKMLANENFKFRTAIISESDNEHYTSNFNIWAAQTHTHLTKNGPPADRSAYKSLEAARQMITQHQAGLYKAQKTNNKSEIQHHEKQIAKLQGVHDGILSGLSRAGYVPLKAARRKAFNKAHLTEGVQSALFETEMLKSRGGYMPNAWWAARDSAKGKSHTEIAHLRLKVQDKLKDAKLKRHNTRRHEESVYQDLYDKHGPEFSEKPEADYGMEHHEAERKAEAANRRYHTLMAIDYGLKRAHDDAMTNRTKELAKEYGGFSESTDVGLKNKLKIAKATIKMSDLGADLAGGMSKRDAVNLIVKHHGAEHAKKLLKQAGHKDEEMMKLLETSNSSKSPAGLWFGPDKVTNHSAYKQGMQVAGLITSHSKLNKLKKEALKAHIHHAKKVLQHSDKMNELLAKKQSLTPLYMHHDSEATKHKQLSDKFHAFAKGVHRLQKNRTVSESCNCDDKNVYHLVNTKSGKVVKSAKGVVGVKSVKAPSSLRKMMDKLGPEHEILHDDEYSNNVNIGKHPDFRKK